jgi:hypothetical protein
MRETSVETDIEAVERAMEGAAMRWLLGFAGT